MYNSHFHVFVTLQKADFRLMFAYLDTLIFKCRFCSLATRQTFTFLLNHTLI